MMKKTKVIVLGQPGATFSSLAYQHMAGLFGLERSTDRIEYSSVRTNDEIVPALLACGSEPAHAVLAVDTMAGGKIDKSLGPFVGLLDREQNSEIKIVGALKKRIHLALMAKVPLDKLKGVVAHEQALQACKGNLTRLKVEGRSVANNAEAIELVSWKQGYEEWGAIGPAENAEKYGLHVLKPAFEDTLAVTTFLLLSNSKSTSSLRKLNRVVVVFRLEDKPGTLASVLGTLSGFNMTSIHSVYTGNCSYDFLVEITCEYNRVVACQSALERLVYATEKHLIFGPFPVRSLQ